MKKEYIEREAIVQEIKEAKNQFSPTVRPIFDVAVHLVSHASVADVAEVRHGEWLDCHDNIKCSVCGAVYADEIRFMNKNHKGESLQHCPDCGAKMDKKSKNI